MRKKTLDDMHKMASLKEGKCLSKRYIDAHTPLKWECKFGHKWKAKPNNIQQGTWCSECAHKRVNNHNCRIKISDLQKLANQNSGRCLATEYVSPHAKVLWRCVDGHIWEASYANVYQGHWCPYCSGSYGEELCRFIFETILKVSFPKNKTILRNGLELDGYNVDLRMAFEYQGRQHYEYVKIWHKNKMEFKKLQLRDSLKKQLCEFLDISLFIIPYSELDRGQDNLLQFICRSLNRPIEHINFTEFRQYSSKLVELQDIAMNKGGECLSSCYGGIHIPIQWKCKNGHTWNATPASVKYGKTWCPHCCGLVKLTIEEMRTIAHSRQGKCLSSIYINSTTKIKWKCKNGHIWSAIPQSVKRGTWCPECANIKRRNISGVNSCV